MKKIIYVFLVFLTLLLTLVVLLPSAGIVQEMSTWVGIAHLLAFARVGGIGLTFIGVATLVTAVLLRRRRPPDNRKSWAVPTLGLSWCFLGAVLMVAPQGFFPQQDHFSLTNEPSRELTLVTYNSQDTLSAADLRFLDDQYGADVYVFPEGGVAHVQAAVDGANLAGAVFEPRNSDFGPAYSEAVAPTTIFVRDSLEGARQEPAYPLSFGSTKVSFDGEGAFSLVGVHTAPPVPSLMGDWRSDLELMREIDHSASVQKPLIVAGDFNATLRHGTLASLSQLSDGAMLTGNDDGTWPSDVNPLISSPIDHVLVSSTIRVQSLETVHVGNGDHRAIIARLVIVQPE